jgi:hypothetical protein
LDSDTMLTKVSLGLTMVSKPFTVQVAFTHSTRMRSLCASNPFHPTLSLRGVYARSGSPLYKTLELPRSYGFHTSSHKHPILHSRISTINRTDTSKARRFVNINTNTRPTYINTKTSPSTVPASADTTSKMAPTTPTRKTQPSSTDSSPEGKGTTVSTPATFSLSTSQWTEVR